MAQCKGVKMYNEEIAKFTRQDLIKHEIMYRLHENCNFIYEIIGETGCGKTTLIDNIKKNWTNASKNVIISLYAPEHIPANNYDVFKVLTIERSQKTELLENVLIETMKDIPYVGNSLSSITSELIDFYKKKKNSCDDEAKEEYFVNKIDSYIKGKEVLFLCYDFEMWDFKSRNLLLNIITHKKLEKNTRNIYFLIESTQKNLNESIREYKAFYINNIKPEDIAYIFNIYNPNITLTAEQQEHLYSVTNGNLDLLKECSTLPLNFELNKELENINRKSILKKTDSANDVLNLLKQVAFIGYDVNSLLLNKFSDLQDDRYDDALDISIGLEYLYESGENISFCKPYLYNYYRKYFDKSRKYYLRLSECLKLLYPSRYDLQFQYFFRGNIEEKAKMHLYIFLIQYYRENNIKYNIEHTLYKCLLEGEDYKVCQQICNAYMYYKTKQYEKAEQEVVVLYSTRVEFRFEIHYLQALIATNKYYTSYKFQEQIDILQQYTTIEFKENHPEMYIRNYMLLIEFYAELGLKNEVRACLKAINSFFSQRINTDSQIACYEQCFKMKANAFYKIEIAYNYTRNAYQFLGNEAFRNTYLSKYYISLLNHSANQIVLGEYEEATRLLAEAHEVAITNQYMQCIHEDVLLNNIVISGFFLNSYTPKECINSLEIIINKNLDGADIILIRNNLAVFYTLNGEYNIALSILSELYSAMKYNDSIDTYYQYYISNNYGVLLWLTNNEEAKNILIKSFEICPWSQDVAYFKARIDSIQNIIENMQPNELLNESSWLNYLYNKNPKTVGKAWKFWSSLMLFSELQIWSDY